MSRFFFDFEGLESVRDDDGVDLADVDQARQQAVALAGAHLRDHPELAAGGVPFRLRVRDDRECPFCEVTVACSDLEAGG